MVFTVSVLVIGSGIKFNFDFFLWHSAPSDYFFYLMSNLSEEQVMSVWEDHPLEELAVQIAFFYCVAYSILSIAYYPARVSNVLGSEHIYGGGLLVPSPINSLYLGPGRI